MGRPAGGIELRRREGKPHWFARFTVDGKRYELSTGCERKADAAEKAARLQASALQRAPRRRVAAGPFGELVDGWLADLGRQRSALWTSTCAAYSKLWLDLWPNVGTITEQSVAAYITERLHDVAPTTVRHELSGLRRFLVWCKERGHIAEVPRWTTPRGDTDHASKAFPVETIEAVIAKLPRRGRKGEPLRAYFTLLWELGLRKYHAGRLEWRDVDFAAKVINIRREIDKRGYARTLPMSKRLADELRALAPGGAVGLVFGVRDHRDALRAAGRAAGLSEDDARQLHDRAFRHSRLTHVGSSSDDVASLMYLAGHKDLTTTSRYVHGFTERLRGVLGKADDSGGRRRNRPQNRRAKKRVTT